MPTRRKLDQIVVVDIEATCWPDGEQPADQENEIIEIGVCMLDVVSGKRLSKRSMLVKPERSTVSEFCTHLTTLTQEQVTQQGIAFSDACSILQQEYISKERVWASYGDYDRALFDQQCRERGIDYPFSDRHLNIKTLFALAHALPRELGLSTVLSIAHLAFEGTHHRGDDDAWNAAAILGEILQRCRPSTQKS